VLAREGNPEIQESRTSSKPCNLSLGVCACPCFPFRRSFNRHMPVLALALFFDHGFPSPNPHSRRIESPVITLVHIQILDHIQQFITALPIPGNRRPAIKELYHLHSTLLTT
jgi:hypothetical protein